MEWGGLGDWGWLGGGQRAGAGVGGSVLYALLGPGFRSPYTNSSGKWSEPGLGAGKWDRGREPRGRGQ